MDIRSLAEAVMETAGKIKNDNMSDQDFYKFKFTELNQKSSKELFFLFYNSIWDCCSVDKIFKLLCDFGLFVWIQTTISI